MKTTLFESASFSDLNAERVRRSRMLPIILAFKQMMQKDNKTAIPLKNSRDYYILWRQLMVEGRKISLKNHITGQEIGPEKFAKSLELLGLEGPTDLQRLIEDYTYRKILEDEHIKFSISKETRNNVILPSERTIKSNGKLSEVGITDEEGVTWEWGTTEDEDIMKRAPEGRDIWVIRTTHYRDGYPCMFLYPYEGSQITKYSTDLDIFFMNKSKETGVIYDYYDPKKFNLLWVACPCTFDWFLKHPVPDPNAGRSSELEENMRAAEETDITSYESDDIDESLAADRKALKRLVESYGKKDVLNYVRRLNESANVSGYTSLQLADLIDAAIEDDDYTLDEVTAQIAEPWNAALRRVNLEDGIAAGWEDMPDAEDVRDSGYFYMGISSQPIYMGVYLDLTYNGKETDVAPGIRIDERGRICPFVATDECIHIIEEMTPDAFASTFKTLLSYQNKNRDIEELINKLFVVIDVEQ